jgi:hypothetical protein
LKLIKLAEDLTNSGYTAIACNDNKPIYRFKHFASNPMQALHILKHVTQCYNCISIIVNDFIVLDVDTTEQVAELKRLSDKYSIKSNLTVKTKNGYHVYYAVDYPVNAQNDANNSIAIKCNDMPITAPGAFRFDKKHTYTIMNSNPLPSRSNLKHLPAEMYQEIKKFNRPEPIKTASPAMASPSRGKNKIPSGKSFKNKPVRDYLYKLDVAKYLFGDMGSWLYVLACAKAAEPTSASDVLNWTRQGKYSDLKEKEFDSFWRYADARKLNINNPFAFFESRTKQN